MGLQATLKKVKKGAHDEKKSVAAELSFDKDLRVLAFGHNLPKIKSKQRQVVKAGRGIRRFLDDLEDGLVLMISELEGQGGNFHDTCQNILTNIKAAANKILALIDGDGNSINNIIPELKKDDNQSWNNLRDTITELIHWNGILQGEIARLENIDEGIDARGIEDAA
jgi:hypothetical protein